MADNGSELLQALAVCAELTGTELSEAAARAMARDLSAYPLDQVIFALTRCRRELKGRLTIAAVLERLDDGRPGPNEAWAMIPQDERGSVVWTTEMAEAYGVAAPLLGQGQAIAARMAFIEYYERSLATARSEQRPAHWLPSLGHDQQGRAAAVNDAIRKGRLTAAHGLSLLPTPDRQQTDESIALLAGAKSPIPPGIKAQLLAFTGKRRSP